MKKTVRYIWILFITAMFLLMPARAEAAPAAPTLKNVKSGTGAVTVSWSKVSAADGYVIYRSGTKTTSYSTLKKITSKTTVSYKDTSALPGVTYYYRVKAYKKSGSKTVYSSFSGIKAGKAARDKLTEAKAYELPYFEPDQDEEFFEDSDKFAKVLAQRTIPVTIGTMTLYARRGVISFKAPSAGKYTFTYNTLRTVGADSFDYNLGYVLFASKENMEFVTIKSHRKTIKTKGGSAKSLRLASPDAATNGKTISDWLKERSAVLTLKKNETVYLYHDLGFGFTKSGVTLKIKKGG